MALILIGCLGLVGLLLTIELSNLDKRITKLENKGESK